MLGIICGAVQFIKPGKGTRRSIRAKKKIEKSVNENQEHYKTKMKNDKKKKPSLRVDKIVAIKIDKVDKASPLHPNVLITKILHVESPSE